MPEVRVNNGMLQLPVVKNDTASNTATSTFEIPVDSFENQLKQKLDEGLPEEE
jgi:hypothetical protein